MMEYLVSGNTAAIDGSVIKDMGFSGVELAAASENTNLSTRIKEYKEQYDLNVPIISYDTDAFSPETERLFEESAKAGVRFLTPPPFLIEGIDWWDIYEDAAQELVQLEKLSKRYGVRTLVPVHYGSCLPTTCLASWLICQMCDPEYVSVSYDPGILIIDGEDYLIGMGILREYFGIVRVRNCVFRITDEVQPGAAHGQQVREIEQVSLEKGLVNWAEVTGLLSENNYSGICCLHTVGEEDEEIKMNLRADMDYFQELAGETYGGV
jgi:sugar phosphate isomerase/epimerase